MEAQRQESTYPRQTGARNRAHHRCLTLSFKVLPMNSPQNKDTKYHRVARLSAKALSIPCSDTSFKILYSSILSCPEHGIPDASHHPLQTEAGSSPKTPPKENSASTWHSQTALQPWTVSLPLTLHFPWYRGYGRTTPPRGAVRSETAGRSAHSMRALSLQPGIEKNCVRALCCC